MLELIRSRGEVLSGDVEAGVSDSAESKGERDTGDSDNESGSAVITWGWGESFSPGAPFWRGDSEEVNAVATFPAASARVFTSERGGFGGSGSRKLLKLLKLLVGSKISSSCTGSSREALLLSAAFELQLKPRPIEVTPQLLPTLAAR